MMSPPFSQKYYLLLVALECNLFLGVDKSGVCLGLNTTYSFLAGN